MDIVSEYDLDEIFRETIALSQPQQDPRRTRECLPLPRFVTLTLDPTRWTQREWLHVHRSPCRRCAKALEFAQAEPPWHPSVLELLSFELVPGRASELLRRHLQVDTCRRCLGILALTKTSWRERLAGLLEDPLARIGIVAEALYSRMEITREFEPRFGLLAPDRPLNLGRPVGAQAFADDEEHDLHVQFAVGEQGETQGTLEERNGRDLVLTLETREPAFAGLDVSFAVVSSEGELIEQGRFKMSGPGFEGWIVGSTRLGAGNLRKKLGASPTVMFLL